MGFSLFSALFGTGFFPAYPGMFFARSFGILSMLIPVYLAYAAFVLADPRWRPDRIFILSACIFPFLTLAVGFAFTRDFEIKAAQYALLNYTGKTGFSLLIIFITVIEVLLLQVLKNALFLKKAAAAKKPELLMPPPVTQDVEIEIEESNPVDDVSPEEPLFDEDEIEELKSDGEQEIDEDEQSEIDEDDGEDDDDDGVMRALEEAEEAAAAYGEQVRKRNSQSNGARYKKYKVPVDILNEYPDGEYWVIDQATRDAAMALKETLEEFKIQAEVTGIKKGPVITMFEILPAPGVKLSKIVGLQDNIALRLAASSVRIVAPIPGKHAVGIEVPNAKRNIVSFKEIIEGELQRGEKQMEIPVVMGKDITGEAQTVDLVQMPHILIAGATGSGKSVCVNSMILSILYQLHPADCRLMLIDPKIVELKLYNDIPHLLTPVITEPKKAFQALQYCICEMERRYACLDSVGVRDIRSYNKRIREKNLAQEHMPYIVVVIDEFADLMTITGKELESTVARLAAMSRAVGIHLVLATQRPSIDVITGLIKANIPSRIAFMVASKTDSRIIIDMVGAEKLLGKGDMLYAPATDPFPIRMQGAFVSEEEVEAVVEYVKTLGKPDYIDDEIFFEEEEEEAGASLFGDGDDPLYEKALEIVMQQGKASASYIQRRLKIGFNRAARLVDEMERHGVVGPANGSKPRELIRGM
jgi:S-DNA-T family DNA segregation ATPase FtsK/SpoIIIE